jgi:quinone-modifying oxidoreductase subunit QmoC
MAEPYLVEPDGEFIKRIIALGGESLKKCYQCATCSVICDVSPDRQPFPRKEMVWAQWGLKDKLLQDPDVWLCHQCNDCSVYCPRGAKPGDVLAAIRNYSFMHYTYPRFLGKAISKAKFLPALFGLPIILLITALSMMGRLTIPPGEIFYAKFIPYIYIDTLLLIIGGFVLMSVAFGIRRFWKNISENSAHRQCENPVCIPEQSSKSLLMSIFPALAEVLRHNKFRDCGANRIHYFAHLAVFYGFIGMGIGATLLFLIIYFLGTHRILPSYTQFEIILLYLSHQEPLPLSNPVKMLVNLSALGLFSGCALIIYSRIMAPDRAGKSTYYDWVFIVILSTTVVSGILTEVARVANMAMLAYPLYLAHLIFIFFLLAYAPYSKFAHFIYRFVAIVYAKYSEREEHGVNSQPPLVFE